MVQIIRIPHGRLRRFALQVPGGDTLAAWRRGTAALCARWRRHVQARRDFAALQGLEPHELRDIGLAPDGPQVAHGIDAWPEIVGAWTSRSAVWTSPAQRETVR